MTENRNIEINNDPILKDFLEFIEPEENVDIIVSAPFGSGKTVFLREDFAKSSTEKYNVFHLFPVNYTVASNEDIYELIKFDLLQECVANYLDDIETAEDLDFSFILKASFFVKEKFDMISFSEGVLDKVVTLSDDEDVKTASGISKIVSFLYQQWNKIKNDFEPKDEKKIIDDYFKQAVDKQGIYQNDQYTKFIRSFLNKIKGKDKKNVLIIDDLDRIDPEHIFRIFNVFSAHNDYKTNKHKFGFDKVVLVCDVENVKKIYQYKYGEGVDFEGYISKFLSRDIFRFDNFSRLRGRMDLFFRNIEYNGWLTSRYILNSNPAVGVRNLIIYLLMIFVQCGRLKLRDFQKVKHLKLENSDESRMDEIPISILELYIDLIVGRGMFKSIISELSRSHRTYSYNRMANNATPVEQYYKDLFLLRYRKDFDFIEETSKGLTELNIGDGYKIEFHKNSSSEYKIDLVNFEMGDWEDFDIIRFLNKELN